MKELLSPAGNMEALYAAVQNGADAVYLGGKLFGARKFSPNFDNDELKEAVNYAHLYGVKVYVTVNTIIYNNEVNDFLEYINYLYVIGVDALIMQDIGMISLVRKYFPDLDIHASTQLHNQNNENIKLLDSLGVKRLVLDRELSLSYINTLDNTLEKEVFIHGALCNSYSGCCLFSSLNGGRSGNRGECVQSCRLPYKLIKNNKYIESNNNYLLSTRELNTMDKFDDLLNSNITSFKIEGRMKSPSYVGYVTRLYRKLIDNKESITKEEIDNLKILFNRDFTYGYLFNDKVMNTSTSNHQGLEIGRVIDINKDKIKIKLNKKIYQEDGIRFKKANLGMIVNKLYNYKGLLINSANEDDVIYVDNKINLKDNDIVVKTSSVYLEKEILKDNNRRVLLDINVLQKDNNLIVKYKDDKNNVVTDNIMVEVSINRPTSKEEIKEKLSKLGNTIFRVNNFNININDNIFVSMKLLNEIRRNLIDKLIYLRTNVDRQSKNINLEINDIKENNDYEISVLARTKDQVEASLSKKVDRIYVDSDLYEIYKDKPNIYLRLPRVVKEYNYDSKNILATEYGAINRYNNKDINLVSDYYLNVVNNYNIKYLLDHNVKRITLSVENDYNNLDDFMYKDKLELIIYGTSELMITKSCPVKELNICPCNKNDIYYLEDINKNRYRILHNNCLTYIMHNKKINYIDKIDYYKEIGIKSYRLELLDENYDEVIDLINRLSIDKK